MADDEKEMIEARKNLSVDKAEENRTELYCSFCGKSQRQVAKLIAAPDAAFICNECINLSVRICSEKEAEEAKPPAAPTWIVDDLARTLETPSGRWNRPSHSFAGNESEHTMFPWPQTDNPLEWLLGLIFGAVRGFLLWFGRAVAAIVSGRGTFAQWLWICLLVAVAVVVSGPIAAYLLRH